MRTYAQTLAAIEKAIANHTNIGVGYCQKNAHDIVGIPSDGTPDAEAEITAVRRAGELYPIADWDAIPNLAYILWEGSSHGHIALKAPARKGLRMVFSPGAPGSLADQSQWRRVSVAAIKKGWPQHGDPVGWTDTIDGVTVPWMQPKPTVTTDPVTPKAKTKTAAKKAPKKAPVAKTAPAAASGTGDQAGKGHPILRHRIKSAQRVLSKLAKDSK